MLWYQNADGSKKGSHIPFNFAMIMSLTKDSKAVDFKNTIDEWLTHMPEGANANWVLGNHDRPRLASRYGEDRADSMAIMEMLLPGIAVVYYGEEIGMTDNRNISWKDTQDPQACNTNETVYQQHTRDPVRTPMQWDSSANAGFSWATKTWLPVNSNYKSVNLEAQKSHSSSLYKLYQTLIKLRKEPAFDVGNFTSKVYGDDVFGFKRESQNQSYVVLINFGNKAVTVDISDMLKSATSRVVISSLNYAQKVG
jgi:alpha-glucosidase